LSRQIGRPAALDSVPVRLADLRRPGIALLVGFGLLAGCSSTSDSGSVTQPVVAESAVTPSSLADTVATDSAVTETAPTDLSATDAPATDLPTAELPTTELPTTDLPTTPAVVTSAPFATATLSQTFVDTSRPTAATSSSPQQPSRTLVTTIVYPQAPGPFPLIELSHGFTGLPEKLTRLATAWATAGYVVALPAFPLTNGNAPDALSNLGDAANQPGDVSFVIDSMLALNSDDSSPLYGRIDPDHIGAAGHSLGAATTYGVALNSCCLDSRIDAIVILAGFVFIAPENNEYKRALPVMIVHGNADTTLDISLDTGIYDRLAGPKWFITLLGGNHLTGIENIGTPYDTIVDSSTTDFWNGTLGAHPAALAALQTDAVVGGLSTLASG
jgi:dienelactone hydrolase